MLDTDALILMERRPLEFDLTAWSGWGVAHISTITCSELLVGAYRSDNAARMSKRLAYFQALFERLHILPLDLEVARSHARLSAVLPRSLTLGAHDLLIAASALHHQMPLLTGNVRDFSRIPGLQVLDVRKPAKA